MFKSDTKAKAIPYTSGGKNTFFRDEGQLTSEMQQGQQSFFTPYTFLHTGNSQLPFFNSTAIQTRLKIGSPGDKYEQEADRMADKVVQKLANREPVNEDKDEKSTIRAKTEKEGIQCKPAFESDLATHEPVIQRKAEASPVVPVIQKKESAEEESIQEKNEDEPETDTLQRKPVFGSDVPPDLQAKSDSSQTAVKGNLESRLNSTRGQGQPLDKNTRLQMEEGFGAEFSNVRIHTGNESVQMNKEFNSQAFTHGSDIYFSQGKYDTGSSAGKQLLAHELTHTVQQRDNKYLVRLQKTHQTEKEVAKTKDLKIYPPVYWSNDLNRKSMVAIPKFGVSLDEVVVYIFGDIAAKEKLSKINNISPSKKIVSGLPLIIAGTGFSLTNEAVRDFNSSAIVPLCEGDPAKIIAEKDKLDFDLNKDFQFIVAKLDEMFYSDSDEDEVISIIKKWGNEKFTTRPDLYPNGGDYLDQLFSKLQIRTKDIGIVTTQIFSYYSLLFNRFDKVAEIERIRDEYSRNYKGEKGTKEISFGGNFWEMVKKGQIRDQIFAYFRGIRNAVVGFIKGLVMLFTEPGKVLEAIGKLPDTLKTLWENRSALWKQFTSASPEEQAEMIGRLFGEVEILIATVATAGAGSGSQLAPAIEVVSVGAGSAALTTAETSSVILGALGETARLTSLMSQTANLSEEGRNASEKLKMEGGKKGSGEKTPRELSKSRRFPRYPKFVEVYIEELEMRFPKLKGAGLKPRKRGAGKGMFEERVRTGGGDYSFDATLRNGKRIQLDDIGQNGVVNEQKMRYAQVDQPIRELRFESEIRDLEMQMEYQSQFISENGLPNGIWETNDYEMYKIIEEIKIRFNVKNISIDYIQ